MTGLRGLSKSGRQLLRHLLIVLRDTGNSIAVSATDFPLSNIPHTLPLRKILLAFRSSRSIWLMVTNDTWIHLMRLPMIHVTTFSLHIMTREKHTGSKGHGIKTEPFCHQWILVNSLFNRNIHCILKFKWTARLCMATKLVLFIVAMMMQA